MIARPVLQLLMQQLRGVKHMSDGQRFELPTHRDEPGDKLFCECVCVCVSGAESDF